MENDAFRKGVEELPEKMSLYDLAEKFEDMENRLGLPEVPRTEETEKVKYTLIHLYDHDPWFRISATKFILVYALLIAVGEDPDIVERLVNRVLNLAMEVISEGI